MPQQEQQLPLVLLVAAGRAARHHRLAVAEHERRAERRTRTTPRPQRRGEPLLQPAHLQPAAEREAQLRNGGRALQPAAAGRSRDDVAPPVHHVDVAGVAAGHAVRPYRGFAGARILRNGPANHVGTQVGREPRRLTRRAAGAQRRVGTVADQRGPRTGVLGGQQRGTRNVGVAVPRLAVGERELQRLGLRVDALQARRVVNTRVVERVQDGQRLEQHRALTPEAGLGDRVPVPVQRDRCLPGGRPAGQVVAGDQPGVRTSAGVTERQPAERVDRLGDETLPPGAAGRLDLRLPVRTGGPSGVDEAAQRVRVRRVGDHLPRRGRAAVAEPEARGGRPVVGEQRPDPRDGLPGRADQRVAGGGVADRRLQHLGERAGAVVAQQQQPGVDGARHHGGERSGTGDEVQAERPEVRDGGGGRSRALAAQHPRCEVGRGGEDRRHLTGRAVEVRLHDVQHEPGGDSGVEGVAAAFQHTHRGLAGQPVRGRDHAERAAQRRPGGERHRR